MKKENTVEENVNQDVESTTVIDKKAKKAKKEKNKKPIDKMDIAKRIIAICAILLMILPICASLIYTIMSA